MRTVVMALAVLLSLIMPASVRAAENAVSRVSVVTTTFPLYDFVRQIGGDRVEVRLLLLPGVEAHAYEPTPADIEAINRADIFVYTAAAMEPWVQDLLPGITNQNLQILEAGSGLASLTLAEEGHEEDGHSDGRDPHVWLDFSLDQKMADAIADALTTVDGESRLFYSSNAESFKEKLAALDRRYFDGLKECRSRTIMYGGHWVFGYLAKRYGLTQQSPYAGFSPDAEPSAKSVGDMVDAMRKTGAQTVFYEELLDPKVARVIAGETGASLEMLSAAHNVTKEEMESGVTFLSVMESNLEKLRKGLGCR